MTTLTFEVHKHSFSPALSTSVGTCPSPIHSGPHLLFMIPTDDPMQQCPKSVYKSISYLITALNIYVTTSVRRG